MEEKKNPLGDYLNLIIPIILLLIILVGVVIYLKNKPVVVEGNLPDATSDIVNLAQKKLKERFPDRDLKLGFNFGPEDMAELQADKLDILISYDMPVDSNLSTNIISSDGIGLAINKANTLTNISAQDLTNIVEGKVTNWKELGGQDEKISVYLPNNFLAARAPVDRTDNKVKSVVNYADEKQIISKIKNDPGALGFIDYISARNEDIDFIGYNGMKPVDKNVSELQYPLTLKIFAVSKNTLDAEIIGYLAGPEFKQALKSSGFFTLP